MAALNCDDGLPELKASQRAASSKIRNELHASLGGSAGDSLNALGLASGNWSAGATVSGFWPYLSEIDVLGLLEALVGKGLTACLPVVVEMNAPLVFRQWAPGDEIEPGKWNIPVPLSSAHEVEPDILLVPLLAFDRFGYRLGYGGGFYDRTLEKLRAKGNVSAIGVAYAGQEVEAVVRGVNDQPLDAVLTEREYFIPEQVQP